jgi:hypothetical protein
MQLLAYNIEGMCASVGMLFRFVSRLDDIACSYTCSV